MFRFLSAPVWRSSSNLLSFSLGIVMLCGVALAERPDAPAKGDRGLSDAAQETLIDLKTLFKDDDTYAVTPRRSNSFGSAVTAASSQASRSRRTTAGIRLVSSETLPESPSTGTIAPTETPPTFAVPQQYVFQDVGGDSITGPSATQGTWVVVAPYGWLSGINGQVVTHGQVLNVNVSPSDVLQSLGDVNGAFMLHTEVGRGDWGLILDVSLIRLTPQVAVGPVVIDADLQQTLMEFLGMYRLVDASDYWVEGKSLTVDLLAGARYYQVSNSLTIDLPGPITLENDQSKTWVDMVIGARTRVPVTSSLDLFARADIGGFGVGSSSNLAWNVVAGVDYQWNSWTSLGAGYRVLDIDQKSGSGTTAYGFDVQMAGPFAALAFKF
ncbi:MAG: hypothetical protein NTZ32_27170 [Planctomycetales bacterium]|nr:hypothetical protein [Planctomycetales bacterium]